MKFFGVRILTVGYAVLNINAATNNLIKVFQYFSCKKIFFFNLNILKTGEHFFLFLNFILLLIFEKIFKKLFF